MPPAPLEYQGRPAIAEFMHIVGFREGTRRHRLVPTGANLQPAFGCWVADGDEPGWHPHGVLVLTVTGAGVSAMTRFVDNAVMSYFGL